MKRISSMTLALCLLAGLLVGSGPATLVAAPTPPAHGAPQFTIDNSQLTIHNSQSEIFTVSGTIRDPDGAPVPDVWLGLSSQYAWDEDTTDGNGFYSFQVSGPTWLRFYIRPPVETRLAQRAVHLEGPFDSNTTQDFDLVAGHLFSGEVQSSTGASVYLPWGAEITALANPPPDTEGFFFWTNWRDGTFQTVLPPDVYSIVVDETPRPYYPTRIRVDLRSADLENYEFILNVAPDPLPGQEPPDTALIALGTPDTDGYLSVTGAPGSVTPFAAVFIAHMTSGRWTTTVASEDGSFSATAYGPPGSFLIIRNDGVSNIQYPISNIHSLPQPTIHNPQLVLSPDEVSAIHNGGWTFVTDRWENMDISWWVSPAFADIDDDGDQDLLAGTGNGRITFFRDIGTPTTPAWRFVTDEYPSTSSGQGIDVGWVAVPAFADIDADGDYDLFIGNEDGRVVFYRNIGTREEALWMFVTDDYLGASVDWLALPALADVDGDGDLDFFVGSWGQISHWRNDGTPAAPSWTLVTHQYANIYEEGGGLMPAFADLDQDGDLDMLLGWEYGPIRTYTNLGTPTIPAWARTADDACPLDLGGFSTPSLADWDGDGDLDMLVGDYRSRVHMLRNDATAQQGGGTEPRLLRESGFLMAPAWTDVGLVAGVDPEDLYHAAPTVIDIDGDGDLDLFVGEDDGTVDFLRNMGSPANPNWVLTATDYHGFGVGTHAKPTFGDLDGDGDYDLLMGAQDGRLHFYENTGTPTNPAWATPDHYFRAVDVGSYSVPLLADLDGDLDLDLLFGDAEGRVWAFENNGDDWSVLARAYGAARPDEHTAPALGDLNGDGQPDLVVGSVATFNRASNLAYGPMIQVGGPATPHLPWMLLADTYSNATRGTMPTPPIPPPLTGGEWGGFQLANRMVGQAGTFFVPRSDPRSDVPITYRLEPFVPFVSLGDRSLPHEPLIPFAFPSGQLHVIVQKPDGSVDDLGTAPFSQSTSRTPVLLNGSSYDNRGGNLADIYQLITNPSTNSGHRSGQFDYQFSQYGPHVITMTGTIEDLWGNSYTGGGTYHVIVGREIDIDPGALPATPFQAGDTLAPTVRLAPAVPADVTVRLRLFRNSDPADVLDQTITDRANRFGYFHPGSGQGDKETRGQGEKERRHLPLSPSPCPRQASTGWT